MAIEVKSGKAGRLKSLFEFAKITGAKKAVRIYSNELSQEKIKNKDFNFNLISLPFYLLLRVLEFGRI